MSRRNTSLISIASEETISFLMRRTDGSFKPLASLPLLAFLEDTVEAGKLPREILQSVHHLLVVPDYWVGNRFHAFQGRKKSIIAAFIERKLKMEQPALPDAADFYNYAIVPGRDHQQQLYTIYLQEAVAYRLYRRMEALGISPLQVTTPAMVWQTKLDGMADGFSDKGVGFIHLDESDCFLYFYFMGQFLFSRRIELPDTGGDPSQTYNLLNYEINQSFYLYSQKTKSSVDALFMMAPDPAAAPQLTELLGREVQGFSHLPSQTGISDESAMFPSCRGFSAPDLTRWGGQYIAYKPLKKELAWRPVQWAGIAVGLILVVLLAIESGYLYLRSRDADHQRRQLLSTVAEPPEQVLQDLSASLDEITRELARPSGSGTLVRTLLAMPEGVGVRKISLDASASPYIEMDAVVDADHPDAFKAELRAFLNQLNEGFNLKAHPIREKDVRIRLDRSENGARKPVYRIHFRFEIS